MMTDNNNNNNNNKLTAILNDILRSYFKNKYSENHNLTNKRIGQCVTLHNEVRGVW
jgi:hypothetical protein